MSRTIKINDNDARIYPLWRLIDPWGTPLRYDYYVNKVETAKPSQPAVTWSNRIKTIRPFPVIICAGPDREFGTGDDITSR